MSPSLDSPLSSLLLEMGALEPLDSALAPLRVRIGRRRFYSREVVLPGGPLWAVRSGFHGNLIAPAEWALLPPWPAAGSPQHPHFVVRAETMHERPAFRPRVLRYRALVPVTGFYLRAGDSRRRYRASDGRAMLLGALYGHDVNGNLQVAIVTVASATVSRRQPLIVAADAGQRWLTGTTRDDVDAVLHSASAPDLSGCDVQVVAD